MQSMALREADYEEAAAGIVHIVDDDDGLRAALVRLVQSHGLQAVGHAGAAHLHHALNADIACCVVLDMRLPGASGLQVQDALRHAGIPAPIIFLTGFGTIPLTVEAMRGGASEFLTKPVDDTILLSAIRRALAVSAANTLEQQSQNDLVCRLGRLTAREREVLALAIGGLMNKQIAGELGTTEITAKVHKRRVMSKMGARSLPDLVRMAETLGICARRTR